MKDGLLAKSLAWGQTTPDPSQLLRGHLQDVHGSALALAAATGGDQLAALGLSSEKWLARFERIVSLSAALHDLGKANDHFQPMVRRLRSARQGLRHEWVSLLLAADDGFGIHQWLRKAVEDDFDWHCLMWAVSGHHPAYGRPSPPRLHIEGAGNAMNLLTGHPDFTAILNWLAETFGLEKPPALEDQSLKLVGSNNAFSKIFKIYRQSADLWAHCDKEQKAFASAVKNCLVGADIAGSALPRAIDKPVDRSTWIASGFELLPTKKELRQIVAARLNVAPAKLEEELRPFQKEVRNGPTRGMLVKAGTGSGKTLAGYSWGGEAGAGKRLYFCYPTTGTASQGFCDHFIVEEEIDGGSKKAKVKHQARLFHSREDIDFEMLGVAGEQDPGENAVAAETEIAARVEALDAWSTPIVNCTTDFVLGLIQNNRRGLYSWPALAGAAFIFDEIHAYDDRLFGALLRFITALENVPMLLMTASLPARRRQLLQQCFTRLGNEYLEISGPRELESLPRYRREVVPAESVLNRVKKELRQGKVLWVCNTVQRAMDCYDQAVAAGLQPILYHSRFRYKDRVNRHQETVAKFRGDNPALVIATQVAEMSLDISATLLVTDLCPVPALIQRLGRLNRNAKDKNSKSMPFVVVEPTTAEGALYHLPYTPEDFETALRWLASLAKNHPGDLSQQHLAAAWEAIENDIDRRPAFVPSAWLDGGPTTDVLELREGSPGITVIRKDDTHAVQNSGEKIGKYTIPMPPPPQWIREKLFSPVGRAARLRGVFVADDTMLEYSAKRGGQWRKKEA